MKNTIKILFSLLIVASITSCAEEEGTIYDVLDYETGAILRTLSVNNALFNSSDPSSTFSVTVEEQDEADGALLESVDIYVSIRDLTGGTTVSADKFVKSYPASSFSTSPVGLPMATVEASYGEAFAALGIGANDVEPGDLFVMELRLNLTDGRVFGKSSAAGIITGGFFSSPFSYNALITCSPQAGDYTVDMQDSYGDGWQSEKGIVLTIDGTEIIIKMLSSYDGGPACCGWTNATEVVNIPVGTAQATWDYTGDSYPGEVSFQITGPGGEDLVDYVPTPPVGLLPVTLCAQ